ncbi:sigma 54-interacting transcriptional regulator [Peribacillus sp. NJ4]|uniref:sigma-54 interaction domain-containing protein n=1 Tax=Peribacillus TaxID=2675229 RepID=UPI0025A12A00|nr:MULTISPECIES: sigma 54-interacting transcriptional regulator [unclassified Peribacillus]MDM5212849.1 sigma 54-interacting transcriptional regulator [Peribacillus sp. NJ4]MDM5223240.1 sigma 54-interacting transcriptional regulator [Peribacillus sp. NJ11]
MSGSSLTLIAGSTKTKEALQEQLEQLLGDYVHVKSHAADEGLPHSLEDEIILYSSDAAYVNKKGMYSVNAGKIIVGKRTVNHEYIDKLLRIPDGSSVLLVNDDDDATINLIESLYQLGVDHIQFIPFRKGILFYEDVQIAVSPGETHLCPPYIKEVIDIGVRLFDITTILEVVESCGLHKDISSKISERYISNIIELQRKLVYAERDAKQMSEHIQNVLGTVDDGILVVNGEGLISVFNNQLAALFHVEAQEVVNKYLEQVMNRRDITQFIMEGNDESKFFEIDSVDVVIFRLQMIKEHTIVATFKSVHQALEIEKTAQREMRNKGFYTKYCFDDIIGEDEVMKKRKQIAKKLALSEHPILIQGETGTGKELFAHAIHEHSLRKNGPFLAVNCSALTETLLESELFGYEEGAFTGAQKGGKKGLFEMADNGTIFLDEIGDISLTVQSHLLRVLQEGEIRRIGGKRIIPINVRVITATNKDLQGKMRDGSFRTDLFYRLNVLNLNIPSLKERRADIPLLIKHLITKSGKWVKVEQGVLEYFMQYEWPGNIRELKSTIDYMLTVCEGNVVTKSDLPFIHGLTGNSVPSEYPACESMLEMQERAFILEVIKQCNEKGKAASRELISSNSQDSDIFLSPQQIRRRLNILESEGFVVKGRGRAGTKITVAGIEYLYFLKSEHGIH